MLVTRIYKLDMTTYISISIEYIHGQTLPNKHRTPRPPPAPPGHAPEELLCRHRYTLPTHASRVCRGRRERVRTLQSPAMGILFSPYNAAAPRQRQRPISNAEDRSKVCCVESSPSVREPTPRSPPGAAQEYLHHTYPGARYLTPLRRGGFIQMKPYQLANT